MALSKFILGKNESKKNSIESKLLEAINNLTKRREEYKDEHDGKEYESFNLESPYSFYNDQIWAEVKDLMEGKEIPGKSDAFYSVEYGAITHKRITLLYKSKLKAESFRIGSGSETKRCLRFSKEVLEKLGLYYNVPNEIVIENESATDVTDATHYSTRQESNNDILGDVDILTHAQITSDTTEKETIGASAMNGIPNIPFILASITIEPVANTTTINVPITSAINLL